MINSNSASRGLSSMALGLAILASTVIVEDVGASSRDQAIANFKLADGNSDGVLTAAEFKKFIDLNASHGIGRAATIKKRRLYNMAFSHIDDNRDGIVTPQELSAAGQ